MRLLASLTCCLVIIGCGDAPAPVKSNVPDSKDVSGKNKKTPVVADKLDLPPLPGQGPKK